MPTFGQTTDGASSTQLSASEVDVSKYTLTENGKITKITARVWCTGANQLAKAVIYADSSGAPGALLGWSSAVTIVNGIPESAIEFPLADGSGDIKLTAGDYWLGIFFQVTGTNKQNYSRENTINLVNYKAATWPTIPDPFGTPGTANGAMDVYATYSRYASLAGAQASGTGNLTRIKHAVRGIAGAQASGTGILSRLCGYHRSLSGSQPFAIGYLTPIFRYLFPGKASGKKSNPDSKATGKET